MKDIGSVLPLSSSSPKSVSHQPTTTKQRVVNRNDNKLLPEDKLTTNIAAPVKPNTSAASPAKPVHYETVDSNTLLTPADIRHMGTLSSTPTKPSCQKTIDEPVYAQPTVINAPTKPSGPLKMKELPSTTTASPHVDILEMLARGSRHLQALPQQQQQQQQQQKQRHHQQPVQQPYQQRPSAAEVLRSPSPPTKQEAPIPSTTLAALTTPTKTGVSQPFVVEPRYAGGAISSSPSPSELPLPTCLCFPKAQKPDCHQASSSLSPSSVAIQRKLQFSNLERAPSPKATAFEVLPPKPLAVSEMTDKQLQALSTQLKTMLNIGVC